MSITEIIRQGLANGDSYEVINKALAEAGFDIKLVNRGYTGWTEQEMMEGFIKCEDSIVYPTLADFMNRNTAKAGTEEVVLCKEGKYRITYNEDGYATKAVRQNV